MADVSLTRSSYAIDEYQSPQYDYSRDLLLSESITVAINISFSLLLFPFYFSRYQSALFLFLDYFLFFFSSSWAHHVHVASYRRSSNADIAMRAERNCTLAMNRPVYYSIQTKH